ncbi:MAG: crossover junction endodeoxyribonuclease RuvC [Candidatus Paceibacterota bacterium]|nr:MAG: crossover junction endodeoxyribonuclease RuvC [Candidatus Paceibacterota bacterium]
MEKPTLSHAARRPSLVRILGIDPGTHRIGFGVIELEGQRLSPLAFNTLEYTASSHGDRLVALEKDVEALIKKHRPHAVAMERLFFAQNKTTALSVSEARGVVSLCVARRGLTLLEFTPSQVKQAVASHGKADKHQVTHMVKLLLRITDKIAYDDTTDALAVAICGASAYRPEYR